MYGSHIRVANIPTLIRSQELKTNFKVLVSSDGIQKTFPQITKTLLTTNMARQDTHHGQLVKGIHKKYQNESLYIHKPLE